ncbi:arginine repressor [Vagococcus elongatus]|uniref:Arginine repressor n=1 Tax=Vagococcus elongatus TaxID=180344 RepID=A0A430AYD1_9ENTE|nr:ArgR family transcriptional regulator [Vagococcus elongatus]RSU13048.1 hypothetical protein CBF29_05100 [Vagococcus elongatus]
MRKKERHALIEKIIRENQIATQEELVAHLLAQSVFVTQATISRDIKEMQLVKTVLDGGKTQYQMMSNTRETPPIKLEKMLGNSLRKLKRKDDLVLLQTVPGTATTLAKVVEEKFSSQLFTVMTDDDKILLFCLGDEEAKEVKEQLEVIQAKSR